MNDQHAQEFGPTVAAFFDQLTGDYTDSVERCFPRYREMLWALLEYLPSDRPVRRALELGCGTGNLSLLLSPRFPGATIEMVDISRESLDACRSRFAADERLSFVQADFRDLDFADQSFDLVISSISIHHLISEEKRRLFERIGQWLTPGGVFAYADQFRGASDDLYRCHIENWKRQSFAAGAQAHEWEMWMQHQADHDHHDSLRDQIDWLEASGLTSVDCVWRNLLWAVVQSQKPGRVD